MDIEQVRKLLGRQVARHGVRGLGQLWGVDYSYISRVGSGEREPGEAILNALGLEKVVAYRKKDSKQNAP